MHILGREDGLAVEGPNPLHLVVLGGDAQHVGGGFLSLVVDVCLAVDDVEAAGLAAHGLALVFGEHIGDELLQTGVVEVEVGVAVGSLLEHIESS